MVAILESRGGDEVGCQHRCDFVVNPILLTPCYKVKPIKKIIAEIRSIKEHWPRPFIEFADDNSLVYQKHHMLLFRARAWEVCTPFDINSIRGTCPWPNFVRAS